MIVAEGEVRHRPNRDGIVDDDRTFFDRADAEDRHLRLIDDRHAELCPEGAWIRDRERAAGHLVGFQLFVPRAVRQIGDSAAQPEKVPFVSVPDHRHDQTPVERDRNADVDFLVVDDVVAVNRGVHDRHRTE